MRLLELFLQTVPLANDLDLEEIAQNTEGMSGDALKTLCTQAGMRAVRNNHLRVDKQDFAEALGINVH